LASILASLVAVIGFVTAIGYLYDAPLWFGGSTLPYQLVIPVALPTSLAFLLLGTGLCASAGPASWPTRILIGSSVRARLLRTFLPTTIIIVLVQSWLDDFLTPIITNHALRASTELIVALVIIIPAVSRLAHTVGGGIDQEILNRHEAEMKVLKSQDQYRMLLEASRDAISVAVGPTLVYVNKRCAELLGFSDPSELMGQDFSEFIVPEDREMVRDRTLRRERGENVPALYEFMIQRKNGTRIPVETHAIAIEYERKRATLSFRRDITERKAAEKEIASLAKFPIENPSPILRVNGDGIIVYANPASQQLLQSWRCKIGDLATTPFSDLVADAYASQSSLEAEVEIGEKTFLFMVTPVKDENYVNLYGLEITERKRMMHDLEKSEAMYRRLFESSQEGIVILDAASQKVIDANPFLQKLSGYSLDQIIGKELWEIESFKNVAKNQIDFKKLQEQGYIRVAPLPIKTKEKESISVEFFSSIFEHSGKKLIQCSIRDITEQLRLQDELRIHNERLEELVTEKTREIGLARGRLDFLIQSNPAVIYSGKPSADLIEIQLTYLSERVVSMLGYEAREFIGHSEFWTSHVHPDDRQASLDAIQDLWRNGKFTSRYRFQHKNGGYRWIREEAIVIRDVNGKPIEVYGYWTDATERILLEEENKRLNAKLTLSLAEVTDEVESLAKLRERLRTVPDVTTGLDLILDSVLWGFGVDFGAVLVPDRNKNLVNVRASKGKGQELRLDDSYPLGSFVELEDLQTKAVTKVVEEGKRSIFGAAVSRIIPILSGKELYGLLALGSLKQDLLDASGVRILELYADLVYSFITERTITVIPTRELQKVEARASHLEPGQLYLVRKDPARAFEIFANTVFSDHEGLCITRMYPPKVRSKYGLDKTPIVWLTGEAAEGEQSVQSIQDISIIVDDFLKKAKRPVILLDGIEYLITHSGFHSFISFLQILKDRLQRGGGVVVVPILEETLDPKELAFLNRETSTLTE
ncbi:MAG: PAS domain S-box protein, partial [Candidatus Bathyarchaeia archaeon]